LGLSERTYALDISLGCSGWVYGLSVVSALLESGVFKRGILLAGDTTTVTKSPFDRSTYPLFGDAGTATAVEYHPHFGQTAFEFGTDGSGFESIMIRDGGYRFPTNADSLITEIKPDGKKRNNLQSILNGAEVFTFGISQAPRSIKNLLKGIECEVETIDLFLFHQANNMMNERIRQKLGIETHKVPYSLEHFGNTSSASIVLTLCTHKSDWNGKKSIIACGFGVGLSWGSVYFEVENPFVSEVNYVKNIEQ
jgi:3-oxoacyl-[acyl-carrier-protein] synthase-3